MVDITGRNIADEEIVAHAMANLAYLLPWSIDHVRIKHGSAFVNEYGRRDLYTGERSDGGPSNPNHLLGCFPHLFPYGCGGFEVEREVEISYEAHICWALRYADRRFRLDPWFMFVIYQVSVK